MNFRKKAQKIFKVAEVSGASDRYAVVSNALHPKQVLLCESIEEAKKQMKYQLREKHATLIYCYDLEKEKVLWTNDTDAPRRLALLDRA